MKKQHGGRRKNNSSLFFLYLVLDRVGSHSWEGVARHWWGGPAERAKRPQQLLGIWSRRRHQHPWQKTACPLSTRRMYRWCLSTSTTSRYIKGKFIYLSIIVHYTTRIHFQLNWGTLCSKKKVRGGSQSTLCCNSQFWYPRRESESESKSGS